MNIPFLIIHAIFQKTYCFNRFRANIKYPRVLLFRKIVRNRHGSRRRIFSNKSHNVTVHTFLNSILCDSINTVYCHKGQKYRSTHSHPSIGRQGQQGSCLAFVLESFISSRVSAKIGAGDIKRTMKKKQKNDFLFMIAFQFNFSGNIE